MHNHVQTHDTLHGCAGSVTGRVGGEEGGGRRERSGENKGFFSKIPCIIITGGGTIIIIVGGKGCCCEGYCAGGTNVEAAADSCPGTNVCAAGVEVEILEIGRHEEK